MFQVGILFYLFSFTGTCGGQTHGPELHPQNGFYNNLFQPDWGAAGSLLLRLLPPDYSDRVFEPAGGNRPNPLEISYKIHKAVDGLGSLRARNALLVFFGQLVVDEIVDSRKLGCPPEYVDIPIPEGHPYRDKAETMMFQRSGYSAKTGTSPNVPRQQQNGVTPFLDAEFLYGNSRMWTNLMREFKGGRLKYEGERTNGKDNFPVENKVGLPLLNPPIPKDNSMKTARRFLEIGNKRGHENPFLLSLHVTWFRWHNLIANNISLNNPGWSDNTVFDHTRRLVTAHFQKIVMYDWLPAYLQITEKLVPAKELITKYNKYDSTVQPGISDEFATAAMRYGHTLVPSGVWLINDTCGNISTTGLDANGTTRPVTGVRLCNTYWDSQDLVRNNFDSIIRGLVYTLSKREDADYTSDIREHLYGPLHFSRQDLAALDILRGRDHGLSDYNTVRESMGLERRNNWREINNDSNAIKKIQDLELMYGNTTLPDDLDLVTGGMLESTASGPGQTFRMIILEQFSRIRNGDRLWFENNIGPNRRFTAEELVDIKSMTFRRILAETTNIPLSQLPQNVFICRGKSLTCPCLSPLAQDDANSSRVDVCSPLRTFDYFTSSRLSFPISIVVLALVIPGSILLLVLLVKRRQRQDQSNNTRRSVGLKVANPDKFVAKEWTGPKSGTRNVVVEFNSTRKKISVSNPHGRSLRFIDLRNVHKAAIRMSYDKHLDLVSIRIPGEVDLILRFSHLLARQELVARFAQFLDELGIQEERQEQPEQVILESSKNLDSRQQLLDRVFRVICLQALKEDPTTQDYQPGEEEANEIVNIKLTRTELADALGLQPSSVFVRNIFLLADKDSDGFLTFREFLDLFSIFAAGSAEEKSRLMFNIYDIRKRGYLTRTDFYNMIRSMLDISEAKLDDARVNELIDVMFNESGVSDQNRMSYEDFRKVFELPEYKSTLQAASLAGGIKSSSGQSERLRNRRRSVYKSYRGKGNQVHHTNGHSDGGSLVEVSVTRVRYPQSKLSVKWASFSRYVEIYQQHIFWLSLYTLVCIGIFVERAYYYAAGREHAGLRRVSGAWTTAMIRGSASVIMFTYAGLLVTMCRNLITRLRETFLHMFIPFDSAVTFHKYVAWVAMVATIVHIVGHFVNLYCMSTQTPQALTCLFREYFTPSHVLRTFHSWAWQTITGLAGIYVTILIFIMYVFATQWARRHVFKWFWFTHNFYVLVYVITFLHGIGALVQSPLFQWFMVGPLVLFALDKLASASRNKLEIPVMKAELLPSAVIGLTFKRPANFQYLSGQWVRIACLDLGSSEYHPFTLTSAPHEKNLSLHIRALGPWTENLRRIYEPNYLGTKPYPKLYVDGPFGEGHQDWFTFDVAVLVGGGIGVTPFASILKDIAFKSRTGAQITCRKVYFLWVTRTQKSFEWLVDIIREVENSDDRDIVSVHIFVTQFQQKYDLRTTMLYICERHFHRVEGRSLFTGLKATTHFGRPQFHTFLRSLQNEHPQVHRVGVFSCGPGPMTRSVQSACTQLNAKHGPTYVHHFENF